MIRLTPRSTRSYPLFPLTSLFRSALHAADSEITLRRIDFVGPQVGEELFSAGGLALLFAFMGIAAYIMFRFEWKFSVGRSEENTSELQSLMRTSYAVFCLKKKNRSQ